uniref:MULE transposase domain-containing protein n=1 Tax=Phytophthora ramorum TaxID=164328 RepID=H3GY82_PHYRM
MPRRVSWREIAVDVEPAEGEAEVARLKSFDIDKSQAMGCSICPGADHKMRYRLLECSSKTCAEACPVKCAWRGKMVTCLASKHVSIFESGAHSSATASPGRKKLSLAQKALCRDLAQNHLRPMRIRHALSRKFATPLDDLPPLKTVQNFVNHFGRTQMANHDRVQDLTAWIREHAYDGSETMTEPFTFAWDLDNAGLPIVGNGSDLKPFLVGITTKALMLRLMVPPESFILHLDGTYKMNQLDYPVLVVGVSDRSRRFHLVALFVMSQETQPMFQAALLALRRLNFWISEKHLTVHYAMADGDRAQCNALAAVFGDNPHFCFLMCFFHVMKHIQERVRLLSSDAQARVLSDVYDLHFARSQGHYLEMLRAFLRRWMTVPTLIPFAQYFHGQWLTGHFSTGQVFATPSGFASTNNPAETFNALLKRDYTLCRRLKMGTLLRELSACCQDQSSSARAFEFAVCPAPTLARRVSEMVRERLLGVAEGQDIDMVRAGSCCVLRVISLRAARVPVAPNNRGEANIAVSVQMGSNYARKEVEGEPSDGWPVDVQRQWCPCDYWFAFGACVHVLFAL